MYLLDSNSNATVAVETNSEFSNCFMRESEIPEQEVQKIILEIYF